MKTRLKELRLANHLLQSEVAKALGCAQNTISQWENGIIEPNLEWLIKLADFFGVTTDYILYHDNIKKSNYSNKDCASDLETFNMLSEILAKLHEEKRQEVQRKEETRNKDD